MIPKCPSNNISVCSNAEFGRSRLVGTRCFGRLSGRACKSHHLVFYYSKKVKFNDPSVVKNNGARIHYCMRPTFTLHLTVTCWRASVQKYSYRCFSKPRKAPSSFVPLLDYLALITHCFALLHSWLWLLSGPLPLFSMCFLLSISPSVLPSFTFSLLLPCIHFFNSSFLPVFLCFYGNRRRSEKSCRSGLRTRPLIGSAGGIDQG